uniref:Sosondowah ankyrin repeat domain family member B n=1 Tax=Anser cygnoides TaxID=8845 RepID=A0A8B9DUP8_ANSCY|nr:ankyrin repeat domain-containing protein SOWAHB [Anser cygnoides]
MARELSQEAVLDFLWGAGGRAPNAALLRHFQAFLRDPALTDEQRGERRERFKRLVNSVATVHAAAPGASKDIVLRRRYRDLLDEELPPPQEHRPEEEEEEEKEEDEEKQPPPPPCEPGPSGKAVEKGLRDGGQRPPAAVVGGCASRGRGGLCCECRRALRDAAARPPPYRSRPLALGPGAPLFVSPPPYRPPQPAPAAGPARSPALPGGLPPSGAAPAGSLPPPDPRGPLPARSLPLPPGPRLSPSQSPPLPAARLPLPKALPPSAGSGVQPPTMPSQPLPLPPGPRLPPSQSPPLPTARLPPPKAPPPSAGSGVQPPAGPSPSLLLSPRPRMPPPGRPPQPWTPQPPRREPPLSQAPLCRSAPGTLSLSQSQSLQTLTAERSPSQTPLPSSCPDTLPSTRLPPSQSRSLQHLPTSPSPSPPRPEGPKALAPDGPARSRAPLLHTPGLPSPLTPPPPASPTVLPPCSQSPPLTPMGPPPPPSLQPPPSQALLPAPGPQAPESSPAAPLPVFRSIRCQLALLEVQGVPASLLDDRGGLPRTLPSKSSPVHAPNWGLAVPLGRREHAWLVAVSAGRWAQVRGLFLEEPELALQRDFMSGFTVLHWLAKHGDGPGLQELAEAARRAGLSLDVDVRSGCGYTPLHLAAIHGHQLVIKVLVLQLGCQVQVRDGSGRRPWEYLGSNTSGEIWQLLQAPRGTIMFPTQPLARSVSSVSKASLPAGRATLTACLKPQRSRGAASHRTGSESD